MLQAWESYFKKDIYNILSVPKANQRWDWDTWYKFYEDEFYFFINIESEWTTWHNYNNSWKWYKLYSKGKSHSHINQPQMIKLLSWEYTCHIFTRTDTKEPFLYVGIWKMTHYQWTKPLEFEWSFTYWDVTIAEEVMVSDSLPEWAKKIITVNAYERNPIARQKCIQHHWVKCKACEFDFEKVYWELWKWFIHVHHMKPISEIGEEYIVDPINDLIPLCPNCHAMIHRKKDRHWIESLQSLLKE